MNKGEAPRFGIGAGLHEFEQQHRVLAALAYTAGAAILVGVLFLVGVIQFPGSSSSTEAQPGSSTPSTGAAKTRKKPVRTESARPSRLAAGGWKERPARKARELMGRMTDTLDTRLGVNDDTLRTEVAIQEWDNGSAYYKNEQAFTDAVKQAGIDLPRDVAEADGMCSRLERLYGIWQGQAWAAANTSLDDQINQMMASAELGRSYLKQHREYPASCSSYTKQDIATGGASQADIERKVGAIRAFNEAFSRCAADMSPEQASRMPQQ